MKGFYVLVVLASNSLAFQFSLQDSPSITTHPSNTTVDEGLNVTLNCDASGNPAPTVTWWKGDKLLTISGQLSQDNGSLTITKVTRLDEGIYYCKATHNISQHAVSNSAYLTVNYVPKILRFLSPVVKIEKETVVISCGFEGKPLPTVQWYVNDTQLVVDHGSRLTVTPSGDVKNATSTLTIINLNRTDEGLYKCVVSNNVKANVASSEAQLTVDYPPAILAAPSSKTSNESNTVTLACELEGKPQPTVTWLKGNTKLVPDGSRIKTSHPWSYGRSVARLTIQTVNRSDEGAYSCHASNGIGDNKTSASAIVTVQYPSKIFISPQNATKNENQSVTLKCNLEGKPMSQVSWWNDVKEVNTSNSAKYTVIAPSSVSNSEASLKINNLKRGDEGFYLCKAQNYLATVVSELAYLTVNYSPKILRSPSPVVKIEKETVEISCVFEGKPLPTVQWYVNDTQLVVDHGSRLTVTQSGNVKNATSLLTIKYLYRTDEGLYKCVVSNNVKANVASSEAQLIVNFQPTTTTAPTTSLPSQLTILNPYSNFTASEGESAILVCNASSVTPVTITWLRDGSEITATDLRISGHKVSSLLKIPKVLAKDSGDYKCIAKNGWKNASTIMSLIIDVPVHVEMDISIEMPFTKELSDKSSPQYQQLANGFETQMASLFQDVDGFKEVQVVAFTKGSIKIRFRIIFVINVDKPENEPPPDVKQKVANVAITQITKSNGVFGNFKFNPGSLVIHASPPVTILNPYSNFTATEGESAILVCNASSVTPVTITWLRDGNEVTATDRRMYGYEVSSLLKIPKVLAKDSGVYKCIAKNDWKNVSTIMRLLIDVPVHVDMDISIEKPFTKELSNTSSPQYQQLANDFETQMATIFQDDEGFKEVQVLGFTKGSIKTRFRITYVINVDKPENKPPLDVKQKVANVAITQITKRNGVIGNFKFKPESLIPQVPPPPPRELKETEIKTTQVSIAWEFPTNHKYYGISEYIVQHRKYGTKDWTDEKIAKTSRNYIISNLKSGSSLTISVLAINSIGRGIPSNVIELKTTDDNIFNMIWRDYKWAVVAVGGALILLILVGILCCRRSRRRPGRVHNRSRRSQNNFAVPSKAFATNGLEMAQLASRFKEIPRDQVLIGKQLGSGQFGQVVKGYIQENNTHCAIKMLKEGASRQDYKDLMNEIEIMSSIDAHPNIINLIGACTLEGPLFVVIELAEHGCLLDYLHKNQMCSVNEGTSISILTKVDKIRIALDVVKGLEHLAKHRCVHRDLAARNVLLGENMTAKLSDFGLARDVYTKGYYSQLSTKQKLPNRWMALEAIETLVATKESDIWSFGVLLWEIESGGQLPFHGLPAKEIIRTLKKGNRLRQPPGCPNEIYAVMMNCWKGDPRRRPSLENLTSVLDALLSTARRNETAAEFSTA